MSQILPLFPLELVVFPGEKLNLHIFEMRYRQLVQDCERDRITFGIPPYINSQLKMIGTELKLLSIEKIYDDGKMDVKTEGVGLFEIEEYFDVMPEKLYAGARITPRAYNADGGTMRYKEKIHNLILELFKVMKINKKIPDNYEYLETFKIAQKVGFNIDQKYQFLQIESEFARQEYMIDHLDNLIPVVKEMESLRKRIQMNGHFKNIIPPEL